MRLAFYTIDKNIDFRHTKGAYLSFVGNQPTLLVHSFLVTHIMAPDFIL
jgi:hypothetical protein